MCVADPTAEAMGAQGRQMCAQRVSNSGGGGHALAGVGQNEIDKYEMDC